jgi:hypothetical protein
LRQLLQGSSIVASLPRGCSRSGIGEEDRLHGFQGEAAHKDCDVPEQLPFACLQEIVTPGNRGAHRLLPRG